ncbi:MAG: 4Fe-4S binding protein [Sulfolobaceae archaeon]|nr:4Fe-4S binding protein [Sulfolobaceae archaeon]
MASLSSWKEIPLGGLIKEPQSSRYNKTGSWRTERPVLEQDACIRCTLCWVYCPEPAILELPKPYTTKKGIKYNVTYEINYDYCKGCGICSQVCPTKAIKMVPEVS